MITTFRALIFVSIISLVVGVVLPFDHPMSIDMPLNQAPPGWFFGTLVFAGTMIIGVLAAIGLLRFRRWGRVLGIIVVVGGATSAWLMAGSQLAEAVSVVTIALVVVAALTWLVALGLSYRSPVALRFQA